MPQSYASKSKYCMPQSDASPRARFGSWAPRTSIAAQSAPSSRAASQMRISSPLLPSAAPHLLPLLPHLPHLPRARRPAAVQTLAGPAHRGSLYHLPHTSMYCTSTQLRYSPLPRSTAATPGRRYQHPFPPEVPDAGLEESTAQDRVPALAVASVCAPLRFVQLLLVLGWRGCSGDPLDTRNIHNRLSSPTAASTKILSRRILPLRLRTRLPIAVGRNARGGTDQRRTKGTVEDGRICRNQAIQTAI
jgi:hypothetical protein